MVKAFVFGATNLKCISLVGNLKWWFSKGGASQLMASPSQGNLTCVPVQQYRFQYSHTKGMVHTHELWNQGSKCRVLPVLLL